MMLILPAFLNVTHEIETREFYLIHFVPVGNTVRTCFRLLLGTHNLPIIVVLVFIRLCNSFWLIRINGVRHKLRVTLEVETLLSLFNNTVFCVKSRNEWTVITPALLFIYK